MMNHATFKASLFMAAGIIDHETGTRDIRRLSGLSLHADHRDVGDGRRGGHGGVPLLNGFLSKEMFFAETIATHDGSMVDDALPYLATLAGMFSVAYSLRFIRDVFFGPPPDGVCHARRRNHRTGCAFQWNFSCGLPRRRHHAGFTIGPFLHMAVVAVLGPNAPEYSLAVWHGFTLPLLMSVIALAGGVALYAVLRKYCLAVRRLPLFCTARRASALFGGSRRRSHGDAAGDEPAGYVAAAAAVAAARGRRQCSPGCGHFTARAFVLEPLDPHASTSRSHCSGHRHCLRLGTAYLAKYHRLAALILMGGAGLVDVHHVRLAVRARSRPDAGAGGDRDDGADPARLALAAEAP